jgi:hypothetical protein
MKFVDGGGLNRQIVRFQSNPQATAQLMATVARAVHYAHQRGTLHRDLKPANILIDAEGQPHITDFGLAKRVGGDSGMTQSGAIVGTPSYMAPEQAAARKDLSVAVDIYSLGAILYELLTGRPPFRGNTPLETVLQVLDREPSPPRSFNPTADHDLATICQKCLEKDPARRYESAAELAADLERWLRGEPVRARPVGVTAHLVKWVRRRPTIAGLLGVLLLLTVTGGAAIAYLVLDAQAAHGREAEAHAKEAEERAQRAEDKQRALEAERQQVDGTLAQILARPLGYQDGSLSASELDALWELSWTRSERVRLLFFDKALASRESATRLQRRADLAVQAGVGLDTDRRDRLRSLLMDKLRDEHEDPSVREACASLEVALGEAEEPFAREACAALLDAMARTTDAGALRRQAEGVAMLAAALPRADAAQICAPEGKHLLDLMAKTTDPDVTAQLGQALAALAQRLEPEAAARVCAEGAQRTLDLVIKTRDVEPLTRLGVSLVKVADRLPPDESAKVCSAAVRACLDLLADKLSQLNGFVPLLPFLHLQQTLELLAQRLGPDDAAKQFQHALDRMSGKGGLLMEAQVAQSLEKFAEPLGQKEATRAAQALLEIMTRNPRIDPFSLAALGRSLVKVSERLGPNELATTIQKLTEHMARLTEADILSQFGEMVGKMAKRLPRELAARVCDAPARQLLNCLGPTSKAPILTMLANGLSTLAGSLPPDESQRICGEAGEVLLKLLDSSDDREKLYFLGPALGALAKRLAPEKATHICGPASRRLLGLLEKARKDDQSFRYTLASSLSLLSEGLPPEEASGVSTKAMTTLLDLLIEASDPAVLSQLVLPLRDMAEQLSPEESARAARQILDLTSKITEPITLSELEKAVGKLAERCGEQDQIELLKHPLCVGDTQTAVRSAINKRFQQHFDSHWKLCNWLRKNRPDLDLISPPRRLER